MPTKFIKVDLNNDEKKAVLKYAEFVILHKETKEDLANQKKKWIRFDPYTLQQVIGELAYRFNRTRSDTTFYFLDNLINHLEYYEQS